MARPEWSRPDESNPEVTPMKSARDRGAAEAAPDRLAVARLLATHGPVPGDEAAAALGWSTARWWDVVGRSGEWFDVTGRGWVLTDAGRAAVAGQNGPAPE
jgi:hypothetical protein